MKNRFISVKIFLQGLRLLRLPGLILGIATLALSLLQAIPQAAQAILWNNNDSARALANYVTSVSVAQMVFTYVAPLLFMLYLFSFLRKRKSSDFYHSIPVGRVCLFTSYTLAAIAWTVAITLLQFCLSSSVYLVYASGLKLDIYKTYYMFVIAQQLVESFSIIAVLALVISITGNLFGNLVMAGLVLYMPGMIQAAYASALESAVGNVVSFNNGGINLGLFSILGFSYMYTGRVPEADFGSLVVPAVVSLLYLGGGLLLFVQRKSEMAGAGVSSAPLLQHICRVAVALPFVVYFPVAFLNGRPYNVTLLVVLGILALIAYFAYEWITSKRFSNLTKAAPVFLVVVAITGVASGGLWMVKRSILSFKPRPEQVESIRFMDNFYMRNYYAADNSDFNMKLAESIPLRDETVKQMVCDQLKIIIENGYWREHISGYTRYATIQFNLKSGSSPVRNITFSVHEYYDLFNRCIDTNQEFKEAMCAMPKIEDVKKVVKQPYYYNDDQLQNNDWIEIYKVYREECMELDAVNLLDLREMGPDYNDYDNRLCFLHVNWMRGEESYTTRYAVSPTLTPRTYELFDPVWDDER